MGLNSRRELTIIALHVISSLTGLCEAFLAGVLVFVYHMNKISYLQSGAYGTFPIIIGSLGSIVTLTSFIGIIAALTKSRPGTVFSAVIIVLCIIPQLYCIRLAGDITNHIENEMIHERDRMDKHLRDSIKEGRKEDLDEFFHIQRDFGCCGVSGKDGHSDWDTFWPFQSLVNFENEGNPEPRENSRDFRSLSYEKENSNFGPKDLPNSCCIDCNNACSCDPKQFFKKDKETRLQYTFHRVGCINIIEMIYKRELTGILDDGFLIFILVTVFFQTFQVFFSYLNYRSISKDSFLSVFDKPAPKKARYKKEDSIEADEDTIDRLPLPSMTMME